MPSLRKVYNLSYNPDNMAPQDLPQQLKELGLGEHEASVYAALLAASPASATYLAKKCGLSRSSVYTTLSILSGKGLVGTTRRNDVKQFMAQDTDALERLLHKEREDAERKLARMRSLKGELEGLAKRDAQVPDIVSFEGQEGLKKIYLSMMRQAPEGSTLYLLRDEFVWQPEWHFIFEEEWRGTIRRWKSQKNIRTKLLVNDSALERSKGSFYRSTTGLAHRRLPKHKSMKEFALYILGDTVATLSMERGHMVGLRMTNAHLAENYRTLFETLWDSAQR
jgi:DNA-binding MarR family transcriptional regulator